MLFTVIAVLGLITLLPDKADASSQGWHKVDGSYHYYLDNGKIDKIDIVGHYLIDMNGNRHRIPLKKRGNHTKNARRVAKLIAKYSKRRKGEKQLAAVDRAAYYVSCFCDRDRYTMRGKYYNTAYGVFIKKQYSCAGSTRALGMVLSCMGYRWHHVHRNQYRHQWCSLKIDHRKGYADGQAGFAGYGGYFSKHKFIMTPMSSVKWQKLNEY